MRGKGSRGLGHDRLRRVKQIRTCPQPTTLPLAHMVVLRVTTSSAVYSDFAGMKLYLLLCLVCVL